MIIMVTSAVRAIQVDTHQIKFFFQIEMFMRDDTAVIFIRNKCQ